MKVVFLWMIFMVFHTTQQGKIFYCFHCHQTSKECNNGVKMSLQVTNCTTNRCFVFKYETEMPGVSVLATFRGCYEQPEEEIMNAVLTEKHKVVKKYFQLCNFTLCNKGTKSRISYSILILILVRSLFLLLKYI